MSDRFADDIFKYIFLNEKYGILIQISMKYVCRVTITVPLPPPRDGFTHIL